MSPDIYLDNNATTPLHEDVYRKMRYSLKYQYGNPSSNYEIGINAKKSIQYARNNLAEFLNAEPEQITFTRPDHRVAALVRHKTYINCKTEQSNP
ncbi:aminotransferase class V-fold PLP-dependent enzyme, partial [Cytobacillus kochii]|uniref:aminotransferase class V-fold PLP-dependent enzyme n=1 Tax=Cytobacillus kochii TaxID=859143 RepID=UPI0024803D10